MLITKEQSVKAIGEMIQLSLSDIVTVKSLYDQVDLVALKTAATKRITTKDWAKGDKAGTGMLYEDAQPTLKTGALAYSLFVDGVQSYFQGTHPVTGALIDTAEALSDAKAKHIEMMADNLVNAQIPDEILKLV